MKKEIKDLYHVISLKLVFSNSKPYLSIIKKIEPYHIAWMNK